MALKKQYSFPNQPIPLFGAPKDVSAVNTNSIYSAEIAKRYTIGTKYETWDGKVFRYAWNGGVALVQALMTQSGVPSAKTVSIAQTGYAKAVGDTAVTVLVTTGGIAASEPWTNEDALEGGHMVCAAVSPAVLGDTYRIVASKMVDETHIDLTLDSPVRNAIAATGEVTLMTSRFSRTVVVPVTTATGPVAGVPLCPVPIGYYYWAQTKGPCPMIVDTGDTITVGALAGIPAANAVAGACGAATATLFAFPVYGRVLSVAAADKVALIDLMLE